MGQRAAICCPLPSHLVTYPPAFEWPFHWDGLLLAVGFCLLFSHPPRNGPGPWLGSHCCGEWLLWGHKEVQPDGADPAINQHCTAPCARRNWMHCATKPLTSKMLSASLKTILAHQYHSRDKDTLGIKTIQNYLSIRKIKNKITRIKIAIHIKT